MNISRYLLSLALFLFSSIYTFGSIFYSLCAFLTFLGAKFHGVSNNFELNLGGRSNTFHEFAHGATIQTVIHSGPTGAPPAGRSSRAILQNLTVRGK